MPQLSNQELDQLIEQMIDERIKEWSEQDPHIDKVEAKKWFYQLIKSVVDNTPKTMTSEQLMILHNNNSANGSRQN